MCVFLFLVKLETQSLRGIFETANGCELHFRLNFDLININSTFDIGEHNLSEKVDSKETSII